MQPIRDLLRSTLSTALHGLSPKDRVSASWSVVCGAAVAARTRIISLENGQLLVAVPDGTWLRQMASLREKLLRELPVISAVPLSDILFKVQPAEFSSSAK